MCRAPIGSLVGALALGACVPPAPRASPDVQAQDAAEPRWVVGARASHSAALALTEDERLAVVPDPDADAVVVVDLRARALRAVVALGPTPSVGADGRWSPAVVPRWVSVRGTTAWVSAERSGEVLAIDLETLAVRARRVVCREPGGVVAAARGAWVVCGADATVVALDEALREVASVPVEPGPRALAFDGDERLAVTHLRGDRVTMLDASSLRPRDLWRLPTVHPRGHPSLAHGVPRAAFDAVWRPGADELWVPHTLYATDTAQPVLNFETTVFPAVAVLGTERLTLTSDARLAGEDGHFVHVVSGLRAAAFTPDGALAVLLAHGSENAIAVDARTGRERGFVEDLGPLLDGLALAESGRRAWVYARGDGTLRALSLGVDGALTKDGDPIATRPRDPMPSELRRGQWVFHTANDGYHAFPITTNHWISCESCHVDEGTAAVTLRLAEGPRDIPSVRAGVDGFLLRTGTRTRVRDFWRTINTEQGGSFFEDDDRLAPYLDALEAFVTRAVSGHAVPTVDPVLAARGREVFDDPRVGCATCHPGPRGTDSGAGNPQRSLAGPVLLHDVGTCVTEGPWTDRPHVDLERRARSGCAFDTPALAGLAASAPYLHDGRAATLRDVVTVHNADDRHGRTSMLAPRDLDALVEYLRSR